MGVPAKQGHDYRRCRDKDCDRYPCRVYREGREDGWTAGRAAGHADGYARGFPAGRASRPAPHGKE